MSTTNRDGGGAPRAAGELHGEKPRVRWFVSHAPADRVHAGQLTKLLVSQLANSKRYHFEAESGGEVMVEPNWCARVRQSLATAQLGVLLLSPAALASPFIDKDELLHFVRAGGAGAGGGRLVPVALEALRFGTLDLKGLEVREVFRGDMGLAFAERGGAKRDRWVLQLVQHLHTLLHQ